MGKVRFNWQNLSIGNPVDRTVVGDEEGKGAYKGGGLESVIVLHAKKMGGGQFTPHNLRPDADVFIEQNALIVKILFDQKVLRSQRMRVGDNKREIFLTPEA